MGPIYRFPNGKASFTADGDAFVDWMRGEDCGGEDLLENSGGDETVDIAEAWRDMPSVALGREASVADPGLDVCN